MRIVADLVEVTNETLQPSSPTKQYFEGLIIVLGFIQRKPETFPMVLMGTTLF